MSKHCFVVCDDSAWTSTCCECSRPFVGGYFGKPVQCKGIICILQAEHQILVDFFFFSTDCKTIACQYCARDQTNWDPVKQGCKRAAQYKMINEPSVEVWTTPKTYALEGSSHDGHVFCRIQGRLYLPRCSITESCFFYSTTTS